MPDLVDPRDMPGVIKNLEIKPELIRIHIAESHSQFYERAEKAGIARECVKCKSKRRYSMVQCAVCSGYMFNQVAPRSPSDPVEGEPEQSNGSRNKTEMSGDGNYSFEANPDYDAKSGHAPNIKLGDTRPLADRSLADLKIFASQKEIKLPKSLQRKNANKSKVRDYIEDAMGGITPSDLNPPSPDGPILDKEGYDASQNQLTDPNKPS